MDAKRFDRLVKAVGKDPTSRRKLLAALTIGLVGGVTMIPLTAQDASAAGAEYCQYQCRSGCCSSRFPLCCDKYRMCCPKGARYCGPGGCYR